MAKRLTRAQLADAADVAESSVRGWESGRTAPREAHIYKLAEVLDVTPEWLLRGEVEEPEPSRRGWPPYYRALWLLALALLVAVVVLAVGLALEPDCPFS